MYNLYQDRVRDSQIGSGIVYGKKTCDDLALLANTIEEAEKLLHHIEIAAREVGLMKSLDDQIIQEVLDFVYL